MGAKANFQAGAQMDGYTDLAAILLGDPETEDGPVVALHHALHDRGGDLKGFLWGKEMLKGWLKLIKLNLIE